MEVLFVIRGRNITHAEIREVRSLITEHSNQSRSYISKKLSQKWQWFQRNGRLKDRACRDILTILEEKNLISLPPLRRGSSRLNANRKFSSPPTQVDTSLIQGSVSQFKPFVFKMVSHTSLEPLWNYLVGKGCKSRLLEKYCRIQKVRDF